MTNTRFDGNKPQNSPLPGTLKLSREPDLQAERILLGTILRYGGENFPDVLDTGIRPDDFYREAHDEIFRALAEIYNNNQPIDTLTLKEKLLHRKTLDKVGGYGYLLDLEDESMSMFHAKSYAKIVVDRSTVRQLLIASSNITEACQNNSPAEDALDSAEASIFAIRDRRFVSSMVKISDILEETYNRIVQLKHLKDGLSGVPTGLKELDWLTGGLQKTDLIILGGRPGMGKTAITLRIALNVAIPFQRQAHRDAAAYSVLFFSLEMGKEQIMMRMLCQLGGYNLLSMRAGRLGEGETADLTKVLSSLQDAPIYIDDSSGQKLRPLDLRAKARRLQRRLKAEGRPPLGLIVVDYLQLLTPNEEHHNREREVAEISAGLKSLAKELDVPVLCCSQLKRSDVSKPDLADLRDSGAIEQDADIVAFILRYDRLYPEKPEFEGLAELQIKKQRNGPTGKVSLRFIKESSNFVPASYEDVEIETTPEPKAKRGKKSDSLN
ncbi:MAG: replicative DNA helicase [Deltaproteobacteria bacterium]|jgi:replicative DNA helicase|nr:replicative DNA helicase [Deltaproteobacteria bacterium]